MNELRTGGGERLVGILGLGMVALMVAGFALFFSGNGNIPGQEPSKVRALFFVVNAATLTGFELSTAVTEYKPAGQITIYVLMVAGAMLSLIVGGWSLTRILNMPYTDGQVVKGAMFTLLLVLLGAGLLLGPMGTWPALFQSTSALANSGHILGHGLSYTDPRTHLVLLPLAIIGGLGVPVLLDISSSIKLGHRLHSHSRMVLVMTAAIYVLGVGLIAGIEWTGSKEFAQLFTKPEQIDPATGLPVETKAPEEKEFLPVLKKSLRVGSTETINSRSFGMAFGAFQLLSPASQWVVLVLMFIGASPGSTGGGIKNTTALVLVRDSWNLWRGGPVGRLFGLAVMWTIIYLIAILVTTVLLAIAQPQLPGERMIFLAVSAITNTGTSHAPLSLPAMGMYSLIGAMLFGRFVPLLILWQAARDTMNSKG